MKDKLLWVQYKWFLLQHWCWKTFRPKSYERRLKAAAQRLRKAIELEHKPLTSQLMYKAWFEKHIERK